MTDKEEFIASLKNEMNRLEQNMAKLEESQKRLSFVLKEVAYLVGVKGEKYEKSIQSDDNGQEDGR